MTPGVYRINPYVFEVRKLPATVVPLGCVGIVTSQYGDMPGVELVKETVVGPDGTITEGQPKTVQKLADPGQRGVLREVLQPGIYYLNPFEKSVKVIWVGYNLMSQTKKTAAADAISFPSKDGFTVQVDVTVVWGLHPNHAIDDRADHLRMERPDAPSPRSSSHPPITCVNKLQRQRP